MHFESALQIPLDHPAFAGHFPGAPIVPGVVLLDAVVHAARANQSAQAADTPGSVRADGCQISTAKFLSPVGPGELLTLSCERAASGSIHFNIISGTRKVATGTLMFTPAP
jgi:3-hydroxyacyl-[acyl-carrier-protein] dehydratase